MKVLVVSVSKISSFTRNPVTSTMGKAKAAASYLNSQLAKYEAIEAGYEKALLLDAEGFIYCRR